MVFLKLENEKGEYVDKNGVRISLLYGDEIYRPNKEKNEGCDTYASLEEAVEAYGLSKFDEVEEEEEK